MSFPTIPTSAAGRVGFVNQLDTTATLTGPNLNTLTKAPGDLLIAIAGEYQSNAGADAAYTGWAGGGLTWTEIRDSTGTADNRLGVAYARVATGSETGTVTVTRSGTLVGDASMVVLVIPGTHPTTAPEATAVAVATNAAADPAALTPSWGAADTLWVGVNGNGMTVITGTWTANNSAPTNYTDYVGTAPADTSTVGDFGLAVAFRQLNAASEDMGPFGQDTSNARSAALLIAVRPDPNTTVAAGSATVGFTAADATALIPSPVIVLAADAITGLVDADPVSSWTDASGSGNTVTQATGTAQPSYQTGELNTLPVVRFDGGDSLAKTTPVGTNVQDFTIFAVVRPTTLVGVERVICAVGDSVGGRVYRFKPTGEQNLIKSDVADLATGTTQHATGTAVVLAVTYASSGAINFYKTGNVADGSATPAAANFADGTPVLRVGSHIGGGTEFYIGDIGEVRWWPRVLDPTERAAQFAELEGKWLASGTTASAETATAPVAAADASVAIGVNADTATVPLVAADAASAVAANAAPATVGFVAADATISTSGSTTVAAGSATVSFVAADAQTVVGITEQFEGFTSPETWADATTHGQWFVQFGGVAAGDGAGIETDPATGSKTHYQKPDAPTTAGVTHSSLVTSVTTFADIDYQVRVRTLAQLRQNNPPNAWEVAWVVWHYTDNAHFYYVALKPNGVELGKRHPAYAGGQRFLDTPSTPTLVLGTWDTIRVTQTANVITVYVNGAQVSTFTDTGGVEGDPAYTGGKVGLYNEDAWVRFDDLTVNTTRFGTAVGVQAGAATMPVAAANATVPAAAAATVGIGAIRWVAAPATTAPAGSATTPFAAADVAAASAVAAGAAAVPVVAADAATAVAASAGSAGVGVAAADVSVALTVDAGTAVVPLAAADAQPAFTVGAGSASVPFVAADAVASTTGQTNAAADAATIPLAAADATVALTVDAGAASVLVTAADTLGGVAPAAGAASVPWAAQDAATAATVDAGSATVPVTAAAATVSTASFTNADAGTATVGFAAADASPSATASAGAAAVPVAAADATATTVAFTNADAQPASLPVAAADANVALSVSAGTATVPVTAADATVSAVAFTNADAGPGTVGVVAADASSTLSFTAEAATVPLAAAGPGWGIVAGAATFSVAAADASSAAAASAVAASVPFTAVDPTVFIPPPVPPPRWVEGATAASGTIEGGSSGNGQVEGVLVGVGVVEGGSSL